MKATDVIVMLICLLAGAAIGFITVEYIENNALLPREIRLLHFAILVATWVLSSVLHTIIHEAGHLVFGLLSGYQFSSFRIFSFTWIKENGKIKFRRLSIAGTSGQCLMVPPDLVDGKIPVKLYNLGGVIFNVITSLVAILVFILAKNELFSIVCLLFALMGITLACINGIPMRMSGVTNDGYNAFSLGKNPKALRGLWIQLKVSEQTSQGGRLKDMPAEWFEIPSDEDLKNSMLAAVAVFACNRLMDEKKFEEADKLMQHLMEIDSGVVELHRKLMICDRIYLELIGQNRSEIIEAMLTKEQRKFMKSRSPQAFSFLII